jgi:hypothetical protein
MNMVIKALKYTTVCSLKKENYVWIKKKGQEDY